MYYVLLLPWGKGLGSGCLDVSHVTLLYTVVSLGWPTGLEISAVYIYIVNTCTY